jgi:peptide/nickel transport system substrate-binding protein
MLLPQLARHFRHAAVLLAITVLLSASMAGCSLPSLPGFGDNDPEIESPGEDPSDSHPEPDNPVIDPPPETPAESDQQSQGQEPPAEPISIIEAGLQEPRTLNPILVSDPLSEEISRLIFSGLIMLDPETGEPVPDLCERWEISDDGTTVEFELREDIYWHDGQPVTARDVQFTYELMMDHDARSPRYSRLVERITAVEAIGDRTVQFRLVAPYAPFLSTLATFGIVPQHLLQDVLSEELVIDPFGISTAVGTGAFKLAGWHRGERILFTANPDYHHGAPEVDQYEYRVALDEDEILTWLEDGAVDWATITPGIAEQASAIDGVELHSLPGFEMIHIFLQLDPSETMLFQDARIREALMLALDREALLDEFWHGHGRVAHGTLPPGSWAHQQVENLYDHDRERAGELLTDAGWATSDDGIRMRNGRPLQFRLITNGDNPLRRQLAERIVEQWRAVGIDAGVVFETWSDVRERLTVTRDFEAILVGYRWDADPDQHAMWSSDSIPDAFNIGGYVNLDVDALLDRALEEHDPDIRASLYAEMQAQVMADLPGIPIVFPNLILVTGPTLQGVDVPAILVRNRATIAEWVPVDTEQREDG